MAPTYTIREFEKYIEDAGYYMFPQTDLRSQTEPEASRVQTHFLGSKGKKLCVPKDQLSALYTKYLKLKEPRPCLIERTFAKDFPLFFDVDYKLDKFCAVVPQTQWEEQQNMDKNFTLEYTFGQEGVKEWFLKQQRTILRITEEVVQETTNQPVIHLYFSVRTCYKYHIYIPEMIVNETIAEQICKEIVHRWTLDAEYQACPQNPYDIVDPSVYKSGLRMLGCDKKGINGNLRQQRACKKLHETVFGNMTDYKETYPSVVGYETLTLDVLKKFSVILQDERQVNAAIPRNWASLTGTLERRLPSQRETNILNQVPERINQGAADVDVNNVEQMILDAVRPYVTRAEIKSRRVLHAASGTQCLVLVPQSCHFKGCAHSRTAKGSDTMWILLTKHRAELRCYACPSKPKLLLTDYNPPTQKLHRALQIPNHATVAEIVFDFVESCMAASAGGRNALIFYKYDYDCNIWREDQFYLHELIMNTSDQLWNAFWNMNLTSEAEEKARKKLLTSMGNATFRNGVMDIVGRRLIKKWFIELGNVYFDEHLNQNRHLCIFSNGTWDWKADEFRQGSPADCSLLSTKLPYIPWNDLAPEMREMVTRYISNFQPIEEESHFIVQNVAFCLDPSNRKEIVFVFSGRGANGKSAYMNLIVSALGDYAGTAAQSMFTQQPPDSQKPREDIMAIRNCRVLCVSELTGTLVLGTMKVLSGHDRFTARHNHQSQIKFYLHFITFILTNETPKITAGAGDHGTWRRLIFAVFRVTFRARAEDIIDHETERVGMTPAEFHAVQDSIAVGFLSLLVEYKRNPHIYPLPAAYAAEQKAQEQKNSIYIRYLDDAIIYPQDDAVVTGCTMLGLFQGFTEWMKLRRSSMSNIDFDTFNEQTKTLLQLRRVYPTVVSGDLVYAVTIKYPYGIYMRGH